MTKKSFKSLLCVRMSGGLSDESLLYCVLCAGRTRDDRAAFPDCGHTFCSACLLTYHRHRRACYALNKQPQDFKLGQYPDLMCPVCYGPEVSGDRLEKVPFSHPVRKLLQGTVVKQEKVANTSECAWCAAGAHKKKLGRRPREAHKYCHKCRAALCERCYGDHETQFRSPGVVGSVEHVVVRRPSTKLRMTCKSHKQEIAFVCRDCQQLACNKCVMDHRGHLDHNIQSLNKVQQQVPGRRETLARLLAAKYSTKNAALTLRNQQERAVDRARQEIRRHADRIKASVDAECERLVGDLDKFSEDTATLYTNHTAYLDHTLYHLHRLTLWADELALHPAMALASLLHEAELSAHIAGLEGPAVTKREDAAKDVLRTVPILNLNLQVTVQQEIRIGEIRQEIRLPEPAPVISIPHDPPLPGAQLYYTAKLTSSSPAGGLYFPPRSNMLLVTEYNNAQIATFDLRNKTRLEHVIRDTPRPNMPEAFFPHKMASDGELLYVTDDREKQVKGYNREGECVFRSRHTFSSPSGIAVSNDRQHLVVSDMLDSTVTVLRRTDGAKERVFKKLSGLGSELQIPEFLLVDDENHIVISDRENHRIVVCDMLGKFLHSFGGQGSGPGQLHTPMGLCCDEYGHLLVVDSHNHRVCRFTSKGVYIDEVLSFGRGETVPYAIAISDRGDVAVTCRLTHTVSVYKVYEYGDS